MTYAELMREWKAFKEYEVWGTAPHKHTDYEQRKILARELAIQWQMGWDADNDSWEICKCQRFFEKIGKRYGLLTEFRENGII